MTELTVLNTRPLSLQSSTHKEFIKYGFKVINFPCIEIKPVNNPHIVIEQLSALNKQDCIIFTSQYAVSFAYKNIPNLSIPSDSIVITVGIKTAQVLEQHFSGHIWTPELQNSQGVIDLLKGLTLCKKIKLISAENGRDEIQNYALTEKIPFQQINVYSRKIPAINNQAINLIKQTQQLFIVATSVTTLNHLKILLNDIWNDLMNHCVICASQRIQEKAEKLGFKKCINLKTANSQLLAERLNHYIID